MTNTNCLAGIKCPECGNDASFRIEAVIVCHVTDDGSEPTGDHHWDKDSFCHCPECEFDGKLSDYFISTDELPANAVAEAAPAITLKPFDSYEISPCLRLNQFGVADPKGQTFEVCDPADADVWTLYGHIPGEGVMAIGDFATRQHAEEAFQRITGIPFGSHEEVEARIQVMHAGPRLLGALIAVRDADYLEGAYQPTVDMVHDAITEATGKAA